MNHTYEEAQRLINDLTAISEHNEATFRFAYELGYNAALEVGHHQAHEEMGRDWSKLAAHIRAMASHPTHAELQHRRLEPSGDAYHAALQRRGGRAYTGGPTPWDNTEPTTTTPQPADPRATIPGAAA